MKKLILLAAVLLCGCVVLPSGTRPLYGPYSVQEPVIMSRCGYYECYSWPYNVYASPVYVYPQFRYGFGYKYYHR